jgi:DNA-binding NarL/FixJ family response regulator
MQRIRVVVADDVDRIRVLLRDLLELDGRFDVVGEAADGVEAVSVVAQQRPDAVVLDMSMPVLDGLDALPLIRDTSPRTGVVLMSSYDARQVAGEALAAGASAYVEKGACMSELTAALVEASATPVRAAATPVGASAGGSGG